MIDDLHQQGGDLRLLETWFPLVWSLNARYQWGDDRATLARLIIAAAPALRVCANADEAHLVLFITRGDLRLQLPA